jgi:hypothetical protein
MTASAPVTNNQAAIQAWLTANSGVTIVAVVPQQNEGTVIFIYS